jgi:hypothetical protein
VLSATGADGIASETPFLVLRIMRDGRTDLLASGVYVDRIRDKGDRLRFAEGIVVCDSGHFDTLLAIPLQTHRPSRNSCGYGSRNALATGSASSL